MKELTYNDWLKNPIPRKMNAHMVFISLLIDRKQ